MPKEWSMNMCYRGRMTAVGIVILFNIIRYFYYHVYLGMPFHWDFFILTAIFLSIAWWGGLQYDRAEFYSKRDPLTRAYNRWSARRIFHQYVHRAKRKQECIGVFVVDVDDFKRINDQHGHNYGDRVLRHVSSKLHHLTEKEGAVVRWGGDEFVVFMPRFTDKKEKFFLRRLEGIIVTLSCGVAVYPEHGEELEELIQNADQKMYEHKRQSRKLPLRE